MNVVVKEGDNYILKVTPAEINEYFYKITWNKIRTYLSEIIMSMPNDIKIEIREKRTDLKLVDEKRELYKFVTVDASEELNKFLNRFGVLAEE